MTSLRATQPDGNVSTESERVDEREQLYNQGECGRIEVVQKSTECITKLNGIMFDLDPEHYRTSSLLRSVPQDPHEFYHAVAKNWLDRHDVLAKAEVRNTGTGVHAILWLDEPIVFETDSDRERWTGIINSVQAALPIDPDQPHITSVTRPVGSINAKNGGQVSVLHPGQPVSQGEVQGLHQTIMEAPFATVMKTLAGTTKLEPCPICEKEGSHLDGLKWIGKCYGSCGQVKLEQLYDLVFAPREHKPKEVAGNDANDE